MKMFTIMCTIMAALLLNTNLSQAQSTDVEPEASAELTGADRFFAADPDEVIEQIESARACELLGPLTTNEETGKRYDNNHAHCLPEIGRVTFFSGGVQYGVIERLLTVGVPVEGLRMMLSDPENLPRFQSEWVDSLHLLVVSMTADTDEILIATPDGDMAMYLKSYLRGFITRRMAEAKPSDRAEVARIWGEIALEQFERYKTREDVLPAFLLEDEEESVASSD